MHDELDRIRSFPRHTVLNSDIFGHSFTIVDGPSFYAQYVDIIGNGIYAFRPKSDAPTVIDGGANMGVSVLYFKTKFPKSRILAFEADSSVFNVLESDVRAAGLEGVSLINKALWTSDTSIAFWKEGADAGRIAQATDRQGTKTISIPAIRLKNYLHEHIDFLKLDY